MTFRPLSRPLLGGLVAATLLTLSVAAAPALAVQCNHPAAQSGLAGLPEPVLFVTQVPIYVDFATIGSTFANHFAGPNQTGRGGDLWILYTDGSLCNVTREGGFGASSVFQGASSIAVRDPFVHPDGSKALFAMVVGNAAEQYDVVETYWQLYEVTGLGQGDPVTITQIADQPEGYNNLTPVYAPDGRIFFTSDRPRDGRAHLYPQQDEYESTPTVSGLFALDPSTGALDVIDHSPSGVFTPTVDSFGRVLFTRWDHLQRDQQAEGGQTFNWASEEANAAVLPSVEVFPEPRLKVPGSHVNGLRFNHFFPWQVRADGTELETLNHIGRHELHEYFNEAFDDDPSLDEFIESVSGRFNPSPIENFFHIAEDPTAAGTYYGIDAPEFFTHSAGVVVRMSAPPTQHADAIAVTYVTHPDTRDFTDTPSAHHSGQYRDPEPLSDGQVVVAHTPKTGGGSDLYDFRLRLLTTAGNGFEEGGTELTQGLSRSVEYWDPDNLDTYSGDFWELQPVAVRAKAAPPVLEHPVLETPESNVFDDVGVDQGVFRDWMEDAGLALIVSRDVTTRDALDEQQPFNLRVPGGTAETLGDGGQIYGVRFLQMFQGDQVRGYSPGGSLRQGRRVLAQEMHDPAVVNPPSAGPAGSVEIGDDGSMAAFVPADRAMTWQLTSGNGTPVVRERYWLTMQAGEVRVCASCHGLSSVDQTGGGVPANEPEALRDLLVFWRDEVITIFADDFESGGVGEWSSNVN